MGRIYEGLLKFFSDDWFFTQNDEEGFLKLTYEGKSGTWNCFAQALEKQEQLVIHSVYPSRAAEDQRQAMAELITRLNYGLTIGNFEMDFTDGEIRFKTSLDAKNSELTDNLIQPVVYFNLGTLDHYFSALAAVLENRATPQEAVEQIEGR